MLFPVGSFLVASVGLWLLLHFGLAERLAIDTPNHRSLHSKSLPRIGGLVLVPAFLLVWIPLPGEIGSTGVLTAVLALISYLDDRSDLPAVFRLVLHLLAAAIFTLLELDLQGAAVLAAILWIGWCTNLYNFMDGTDGLAGGMALCGFSVYGIAVTCIGGESLSIACFSIAAATAGFLLFNFPPAKTFMGDAGSVSLGFLVGAIGLLGWQMQAWPLWFPVLVFSPFIVDATITLVKRVLHAERVWQAHHQHYYQRLVHMGWSHRRLAMWEYALMAACGASALVLLHRSKEIQFAGLAAWAVIYAVAMIKIDLCWKKFSATSR